MFQQIRLILTAAACVAIAGVAFSQEPPQARNDVDLSKAADVAGAAPSQEPPPAAERAVTLKMGDKVPALQVSKWVKGDAVKEFEKDKVYVVEFWATWCGPCKVSIPHVSKLQQQYKDKNVVMIGQDAFEHGQEDGVPVFVEKMGDEMNYRVAMDDLTDGADKGKMALNWMQAAGENGIPTAFIVDKTGIVAWIGHPMEMDKPLEQIVGGTYDLKKVLAEREALKKIIADLKDATQKQDWDKALAAADEMAKLRPDQAESLNYFRFDTLLNKKKDYTAAYALGGKLYDAFKDNAQMLNQIAWSIATDDGIEKRDLNLAEKCAARAVEVSQGNDANMLDTLARINFDKGNVDKAIELQTKAVEKADASNKDEITKTLKKYQDKKDGKQ